ncbi:MAG: hypothetical protein NTZ49_02565 [Candidatus Parcubacteria bacterium]|nr:hypothetical protein [Candidatus Parcubacteria bacterium]
MKKIFIILAIIILSLFCGQNVKAADLSAVSLSINPQISGSLATWTIFFTIPQDTKIGHILISLGGYQPDLGSAELFVSGIPQGNPIVGKSNPNCVFNCDDIRYYYTNPISVKKGTKITFTLNKVKNSSKAGDSGINYISVFSSKYPQLTLAFSSGEKLLPLVAEGVLEEEPLLPPTATNEGEQTVSLISQVNLNELFFQPGSKTTKFSEIKDPTKVSDLTLDLIGREKITFNGIVDLSTPEAVKYFEKLSDYLTLEKLVIDIKQEFLDYFKVPLEVTFYDLPFVFEPDLLKNDDQLITKDKIEGYHFFIYNDKPQLSLILKEGGKYRLVPRLEVYITDNQKIYANDKSNTFSGKISDPNAQINVSLNGKEITSDIKPDSEQGSFSFELNLVTGANLIEVRAESAYGKLDKVSRIVDYISTTKENTQTEDNKLFSPINIIAIVLAFIAVIFIWAIRHLAKKKK